MNKPIKTFRAWYSGNDLPDDSPYATDGKLLVSLAHTRKPALSAVLHHSRDYMARANHPCLSWLADALPRADPIDALSLGQDDGTLLVGQPMAHHWYDANANIPPFSPRRLYRSFAAYASPAHDWMLRNVKHDRTAIMNRTLKGALALYYRGDFAALLMPVSMEVHIVTMADGRQLVDGENIRRPTEASAVQA